MIREFLADTSLWLLPVIAMCMFAAIFVTVLLRIGQSARTPEYQRMASLPLTDVMQGDKTP